METPAERATTTIDWRDPAVWRAVLYYGALPALVALLPVLLPLPLILGSGWRSTWLGSLIPGLPFLILGAVWGKQILDASDQELVARSDDGTLDPVLSNRLGWAVVIGVWVLLIGLPLRYGALHAMAERWRFKLTSKAALQGAVTAWRDHGQAWAGANPPGQAFEPADNPIDPAGFRGPFGVGDEGAIGKMAFDPNGCLYYVLHRPVGVGPDVKGFLDALAHRRGVALELSRSGSTAGLWVFERGLVHVPRGALRPTATVWSVPVQRLTPLGHRWFWYVAGQPFDQGDTGS